MPDTIIIPLRQDRRATWRREDEDEAHRLLCEALELVGATELAIELDCSVSNVHRMVGGQRGRFGLAWWKVRRCQRLIEAHRIGLRRAA